MAVRYRSICSRLVESELQNRNQESARMAEEYGEFSEAYLERLLDEETVICDQCDLLFSDEQLLEKHISKAHNRNKEAAADARVVNEIVCELCQKNGKSSKKFHKLADLKLHFNQAHVFKAYGYCKNCNQPFLSKAELELHTSHCPYEF